MLTNCHVAQEGFDAPVCSAVIMARPIKSRALFLQMAGRGLCPHAPSRKKDCLLLDFAGLLREHGLPSDPMRVTLEDGFERGEGGDGECDGQGDGDGVETRALALSEMHEWRSVSVTMAPAQKARQHTIS